MIEIILSQLIVNAVGESHIKADIDGVSWFVYPTQLSEKASMRSEMLVIKLF